MSRCTVVFFSHYICHQSYDALACSRFRRRQALTNGQLTPPCPCLVPRSSGIMVALGSTLPLLILKPIWPSLGCDMPEDQAWRYSSVVNPLLVGLWWPYSFSFLWRSPHHLLVDFLVLGLAQGAAEPLHTGAYKNDRKNSGGTLRQKETKRRQTES